MLTRCRSTESGLGRLASGSTGNVNCSYLRRRWLISAFRSPRIDPGALDPGPVRSPSVRTAALELEASASGSRAVEPSVSHRRPAWLTAD